MVRMPACHAGGRGFESLPGRQLERYAGIAQLVEQLTCNQQVVGSSPIASSNKMGEFPSGQRGQTVNLLRYRFDGSNPSSPTRERQGKLVFFYFI